MDELAPVIQDKFVLSKNFQSQDEGAQHLGSLMSNLKVTDKVPSNVTQLDMQTTVIHQKLIPEENKETPIDEIMELKGNKQLSVEVKLSDLVRYGPLGQGASGFVEKAVHVPTKKIIALKVISLQTNEKMKK